MSPIKWSIKPGKGGVRLTPSIGNWSYACNSHYWIWDGRVVWDAQWSHERIEAGRVRERKELEAYYAAQDQQQVSSLPLLGAGLLVKLKNTLLKWLNR